MQRLAGLREAVLVLAVTGSAMNMTRADTLFTFTGTGNSQVVLTGKYGPVYAGAYSAALNGMPINVFCVDFNQEIALGDQYQAALSPLFDGSKTTAYESRLIDDARPGYAPVNHLSSISAQTRAGEIAYLSDLFLPQASTENSTDLAAVSLSIWNIAQNGGGDALLSQSDCNFKVLNGLVIGYEAQASKNYAAAPQSGVQFIADDSGTNEQEFAYVPAAGSHTVSAVPEPAGMVPMLLGASGTAILISLRRRKAGSRG